MSDKIGIYSGTFDPVHIGHINFALDGLKAGDLSAVYFLPERLPRNKSASHYAHRLAMIKLAIKPHANLKVIDLPDRQFSVNKTLPKLKKLAGNNQIYLLHGSDDIKRVPRWPGKETLLKSVNFIVGLRKSAKEKEIRDLTKNWPSNVVIINSTKYSDISSGQIRESIMKNQPAKGLLASTKKYISKNWLYISLDKV